MNTLVNFQSAQPSKTGQFSIGVNRRGIYTFRDGSKYVGEFKADKFNGRGEFTYPNGNKYVGEFKDDDLNGLGEFTYANGGKFVGEFKNNRRNGPGTYTALDGSTYVGEFKDDKRHGNGTIKDATGAILEKGIYKDDNFVSSKAQQQTTALEEQRIEAFVQKFKEEAARRVAADQALKDMMRRDAIIASSRHAALDARGNSDRQYGISVRACVRRGVSFASLAPRETSNPNAQYRVLFTPDGEIAEIRLTKSSGVRGFDQAVETGIRKCSPFPRPDSGIYHSSIDINYNMYD